MNMLRYIVSADIDMSVSLYHLVSLGAHRYGLASQGDQETAAFVR